MADFDEAVRGVRQFLLGLGLDPDLDPELAGTPERVARAFRDEFLGGYQRDPLELLRDGLPTTDDSLVLVGGIHYASMCPHHLLPCQGIAHVGYLPRGRIVGLGVIAQVVDIFARRLVLQEELGRQIASAISRQLDAASVGVVLEANHACLSARGERQSEATVVTHSFEGGWSTDALARSEFLGAVLPLRGGGRRT